MNASDSTAELLDMHASLDRLLKTENHFGPAFYSVFMTQFPEIGEYFHGVSMQRLEALMPMALSVIFQHHQHRYPSTRKYLEYIGSHHSLRGIPPEVYPKFKEAFIATLVQLLANAWHPALEQEWRNAIDETVDTMISAYGQRITI